MKIALLSRWYWEENRRFGEDGGPTRQLAEAVAARGHEVVVLSQSNDVRKLTKSKIGALETWLSPRDKRRDLATSWRDRIAKKTYGHRKLHSDALTLRDFLAKRGPFDVIWAQTEAPDGLVAGFATHLKFKLPPILVQIQALRYRFEKGAPVFTEKAPLMLAFRHATRIVANSEMVAGYLSAYTGATLPAEDLAPKVRVVYPNLQLNFLKAAQEDPLVSPPMKDRILFLGALNVGKGALVFLNSLPKTEMSKRSSVFAVIGDFTENNPRYERRWEETKETVRVQTLGARIEYLGKVSTFEVIRQIKLAKAVVIPVALRCVWPHAGRGARARPPRHHHGQSRCGRARARPPLRAGGPGQRHRLARPRHRRDHEPHRPVLRERHAARPAPPARIHARRHRDPDGA